MDGFIKFLGLAAGVAVITLTLRGAHKEMGAVFSILAGAALLMLLVDKLSEAVASLRGLAQYAALDETQIGLILKILGVSFAAEFAAQACRDAGEEGMALRVELGCKLMLVVLAMPLLEEIAKIILELTA